MGGFPITALLAGGGIPAYSPLAPPAESEDSAGWAPEGFIPAACYGPLVYNYISLPPQSPLTIDASVLFVSNPYAGGGKAVKYTARVHEAMDGAIEEGRLEVKGDIEYLETRENPKTRILDSIRAFGPSRPVIVFVSGGDGSCAVAGEAALEAEVLGYRAIVVPGYGGTAHDMQRELGVPKNPRLVPEFLASAARVELDVVKAGFDGGSPGIVLHSQGNGVSGAVFSVVGEGRARTGRSSISMYLKGLVEGVANTETFYLRANGGEPMAVGEVLMLVNTTSMGGIARVPLPIDAARIHALPVKPNMPGPLRLVPGLLPLGDVMRRGALYMLGDEGVIAPGKEIKFLSDSRKFDVRPGTRIVLEFVDAQGNPKPVLGVLNGDAMPAASRIVIEGTSAKIASLASPDSGFMIRHGLARPGTILEKAARTMSGAMRSAEGAAPIILIGGYEVFRDAAGFTPSERQALDTVMFSAMIGADALALWKYGSVPYVAEMPLIIPTFEVGYRIAAGALDAVGRGIKVKPLERDRAANRIASIGAGFATSYHALRFVGIDTWKAASSRINSWMVRYIGGAGAAVEGFLAGAARFIMPFFKSAPGALPIIIIDPRLISPEPNNPAHPEA